MRTVVGCQFFAFAVLFALGSGGCKPKPSKVACEEAVANIRRINGGAQSDIGVSAEAMVRSCRGNSTKQTVECMRDAKTSEDLQKCEGEIGAKYFDEAKEAAKPDEVKETAKPDEAKPDEAKPDEAKPDEAKLDEAKPDEAKPDEAKPDEAKLDEAKPDEAKLDEAKPEAKEDKDTPTEK